MGFKVLKVAMCINQGHQDVDRNLANLPKHTERSNMAAVGLGFCCIRVMIISKYTFVELLNEMEPCLRILDCREMSTKVLKR